MALDWYSTNLGDEARRKESSRSPGRRGGEIDRKIDEEARTSPRAQEQNAWQVDGRSTGHPARPRWRRSSSRSPPPITRAGRRQAAERLQPGRRSRPFGTITALLIAYRIIQEPGFDDATA